jgi:uncharacterized protein (DUF697 family)
MSDPNGESGPSEHSAAGTTPAPEDRRRRALDLVDRAVRWSFGAGLIPLPVWDLAATTAIQLKMLSDLSDLYEVPFSDNRGKAILGALAGGMLPAKLGWGSLRSLLKAIPVVGSVVGFATMPAAAAAATFALGRLFVEHFESGGNLLDLDFERVQDYLHEQVREAGRDLAGGERREVHGEPETAVPVR